jgi:hypothetical protein
MFVAIALIVFATLYRILPTLDPTMANFSPVMAIAFCGAVYFRNRWMWLVPFIALAVSDLYINHFYAKEYGFTWPVSGLLSWLNLLTGSLTGALLFYIVTNTQSWGSDAFYPKTLAGWWQALTIGHPQYPPTIFFFRNTLFGDLMFTGLFAGTMEWLAHLRHKPSLLDETGDADAGEQPAESKPQE